ncbi:MAG: hypothetical protein WD851_08635 [Pirellulales bacterium]
MRSLIFITHLISPVLLCAGCQNQPSHFANPLYSADRVPPPATRSLAPGSAAPYYSGDPLPVLPAGSPLPPPGHSSSASVTPEFRSASQATAANSLGVPQVSVPSAPPPVTNAAGWWDTPLKSTAPAQEVLPVAWSDMPAASTPPRVRMPYSQAEAASLPLESNMQGEATQSTDGFRPRG